MSANNTYVAIMAGGIGSRFWPQSRSAKPKQFLDILNTGKSLIRLTYERFAAICPPENFFVVTNEDYCELVLEQLPELKPEQVLGEPSRRNTAPCIAYVSHKLNCLDPDSTLIVSPADHVIAEEANFHEVVREGVDYASQNDALVTLGMRPSRPDTGYGYIQYITEPEIGYADVHKVKTFTEKPNLELAKTFIQSGDFLWNSGMFIWSIATIVRSFVEHQPEMWEAFRGGGKVYNTSAEKEFITRAYSLCTVISIDYAILERARNVYVIPADFGWSDVGTWASLYTLLEKDYLANAVHADNAKLYDSAENMVMADKKKLVVLQDMNGYCVIDTDDVLLICPIDKEQDIKKITHDLKTGKLARYL